MLDSTRVLVLSDGDPYSQEVSVPLKALQGAGLSVGLITSRLLGRLAGAELPARPGEEGLRGASPLRGLGGIIVTEWRGDPGCRGHARAVQLVRSVYSSGRVVGAIGTGPEILIHASAARGSRLTSCRSIAPDLLDAGAVWVDQPVVRDGSLVTSRGAVDMARFMKCFFETLSLTVW